MSVQVVRQKLVQSGVEADAFCLNIHTGWYNEEFSYPGVEYQAATLWDASVPSGTTEPSFMAYAMDPRERQDVSKVRCFALQFQPPFAGIREAKAWVTPVTVPSGWSFEVSINASWEQHLQRFRPLEDFFTDDAPNLMPGYDTRLEPADMDITDFVAGDGYTAHTTNWVSIRATVNGLADPGPPFGETGGLANPLVWNFSWAES